MIDDDTVARITDRARINTAELLTDTRILADAIKAMWKSGDKSLELTAAQKEIRTLNAENFDLQVGINALEKQCLEQNDVVKGLIERADRAEANLNKTPAPLAAQQVISGLQALNRELLLRIEKIQAKGVDRSHEMLVTDADVERASDTMKETIQDSYSSKDANEAIARYFAARMYVKTYKEALEGDDA